MRMTLEALAAKTDQNSQDINKLAVTVAELAGVAKGNEARYTETHNDLKSLASGIAALNDKFSNVMGLGDKVAGMKEDIAEMKGDFKTQRQALETVQQSVIKISSHNDRITKLEMQVDGLEKRNLKQEGAGSVIKVIASYAIGPALIMLYWLISQYITAHSPSKVTEKVSIITTDSVK